MSAAERIVRRSTSASRKAAKSFSAKRPTWQLRPAWSLRADFVRCISGEDWQGLRSLARRCINDGERALGRIIDAERALASAAETAEVPKALRKELPGS